MTTQIFYPTQTSDDGSWGSGTSFGLIIFANTTPLTVGKSFIPGFTTFSYHAFILFNSGLNGDLSINYARMKLYGALATAAPQDSKVAAKIYGIKQVNPSPPVSAIQVDALPLTDAFVDWEIPPARTGTILYSPDLVPILNEIKDQSGFSITDDFMLVIKTDSVVSGTGNDWLRYFYGYESGYLPSLEINSGKSKISISESIVKTIATGDRPIRP